MYKVEKKNRVLRIPDEKFDEYKKMGYIIRDENDNVLFEPENIKATANKLQKENEDLKADLTRASETVVNHEEKISELEAKLTEATLYAENADKKIADLQKENEELKAAIQAQATMGSATPVSEDSGKKKTTKTPKQSE